MKCISCGKEIPAGNVYCPICGKEAQIISDKSVLEDDLLKVLLEDDSTSVDEYTPGNSNKTLSDEEKATLRNKKRIQQKKKQKKTIMIIGIIVIICIVAVVAFFMVRRNNNFDNIYEKAEVAYHTGQYEEALELAVKALDKNPESVYAYMLLGDIYVQLEDIEKAESCYLKAIESDSSEITAYEQLLKLYSDRGDYTAIQTLYDSVPEDSKDILKLFTEYLIPMPEVNYESGEYTKALEVELSADKNFKIYYTLDGTKPSESKELYNKPITIKEDGETVLKAICVDADGNVSDILEVTYLLEFEVPNKPEVTPDGGQFDTLTQVSVYVQEGTTVYYTWDGSAPNKSSAKYEGPIEVPEGNNVLSVIAIDDITDERSEIFKTNFIYYPADTSEETQ